MRELGTIVTFYQTESTIWTRVSESWYIKYKEPFVAEITSKEYHELSDDDFEFHKPWIFNNKEYKYLEYYDGWGHNEFRVYPNETLQIKKVWMPLKASCSFEYLSSHMDCVDFIEYMKDHGMNVCLMR